MFKKIMPLVVLSLLGLNHANASNTDNTVKEEDKPIEFNYEDLRLGKINHIKYIADFNNAIKDSSSMTKNNDQPALSAAMSDYKELIKSRSGTASSAKMDTPKELLARDTQVLKNITNLEAELTLVNVRNEVYKTNKRYLFVDTQVDEIKSECFYKVYSTLKICFEYGDGKVYNITKLERKDNVKMAKKEKDEIVLKIKEMGFTGDDDYFVKGDKKFTVTVEDNTVKSIVTTTELESLRADDQKILKDKHFNNSVNEHLEHIKTP